VSNFTRINKPITYLITNGHLTKENFSEKSHKTLNLIKSAAKNGISLIQIREKNLPTKLVFELVSKVCEITKNSQTKVLVNNRLDIAIAAAADGIHLTSKSIPTSVIRQRSPKDFIIGVSTHTFEKAKTSKYEGADFVTFSPVFKTSSKLYGEPKGLSKLNKLCEELKPFPILALGGIDGKNFKTTIENGASGFAGISFFNNENNLESLK
jgi:thiamine-phosphate pyrophosphorylase